MKLSQVSPELRPGYRIMRQAPVGSPLLLKLANRVMRFLPDAKAPEGMTL